jgi:outer membrane protein
MNQCTRVAVLLLVFFIVAGVSSRAQQPPPPAVPAGPLTLEQVLELVEPRSEAVGIARTAIERARGEQIQARSGLFPQLTASASYDRALASEFSSVFGNSSAGPSCAPFTLAPGASLDARVSEIERAIDCGAVGSSFFGGGDGDDEDLDLPFGRSNTWRVNLAFSQNLYTGGRLRAQGRIAAVGIESAELGLTTTRAQLLFDVTRAFYDVALSEQFVRIAEATLAQADATVAQVQAGFEAGAQPEFELLRARVTRDNQRPVVIRQRANREIAQLRLKQLLDLPEDYPLQIIAPLDEGAAAPPAAFASRLPAALDEIPTLPAERTVVQEARAAVRLSEATLSLTEAERRPSLAVTTNYSNVAYPSDFFPTGDVRTNWTIGAAMQLPILTGGRQRGSEVAARAGVEGSRLRLRQVEQFAQLDSEASRAEYVAARAAFEASGGTIAQAQRAYEIAEVRFKAGVSTQLELSDARLQLQQAEANRAQAARDLQIARARIALLPDLPLGAASDSITAPATPTATPPRSGATNVPVPTGSGGGRQ